MLKQKKRLLALLMAAIALLASCRTNDDVPTPSTSAPETVIAYTLDNITLPNDLSTVTHLMNISENICFLGENASNGELLPYVMNADGEITAMPQYAVESDLSAAAMCAADGDTVWIAELGYNNSGANNDGGYIVILRKLDVTGAEITRLDISSEIRYKDTLLISAIETDSIGNLYIFDRLTGVNVFDKMGILLSNFENGEMDILISIFKHPDGDVYALKYKNLEAYTVKISPGANLHVGETPLRSTLLAAYKSGGKFDYLCMDSQGIFGVDGDLEILTEWFSIGINFEKVTSLVMDNDDAIYCAWQNSAGRAELAILTVKEVPVKKEKIELTLLSFGPNGPIRNLINIYNAASSTYEIRMIEYQDGWTTATFTADSEKLRQFNAALFNYNPDIVIIPDSFPYDSYMAKGLFADLYPYIDNDKELGGRDVFVPQILNALEYKDGGLYQMCRSFSVHTAVGLEKYIGDRTSWTMEEMTKTFATMPSDASVMAFQTAIGVLEYFLKIDIDSYVDWETGTCSFDSREFIDVLLLANSFPYRGNEPPGISFSPDPVSIADLMDAGKVLISPTYIKSFLDFQVNVNTYGTEDLSYVGYPSQNGSGNAFQPYETLAIIENSEHKDAAWEFVKLCVSIETQRQSFISLLTRFPVNKQAFEEYKQLAMTPRMGLDENNNEAELPRHEGFFLTNGKDIYAVPQADVDKISELIANTDKLIKNDIFLNAIIFEEAGAYFGGVRTVEEAAKIIQSRASIYISEQQ